MSFSNRHSIYSTTSATPYQGAAGAHNIVGTLTTSSLLSALHNAYQSGTSYQLDAATTLVVNSGSQGSSSFHGVFDEELGMRAWEHARRRAEDQTIVLTSLQSPAPSLMLHVLSSLPSPPDLLNTCLNLVSTFTNCLTPVSPFSVPRHNGLAVSVQISLSGSITGAHISLSNSGLDTENGLLHIPSKEGYRAFDVFYYLLSAISTPAERQGLGLQSPDQYALLSRSGTYSLPSYLPTADDSAAAEDWRANLRAIGIKGSLLRGLLSVLAGILKLGNSVGLLVDEEVVDDVCEDVSGLLGIEPEVLSKKMGDTERELFIGTIYELLVEWIIGKANDAILADFAARKENESNPEGSQEGDTVQITVLELPNDKMSKAICLKGVFDDESGLNVEMKADGVDTPAINGTVVREMRSTWSEAEKDGLVGMGREREYENDRKEQIIEKGGREVEEGGFLKEVLFPDEFGRPPAAVRIDVPQLLASSRAWYHLNLTPTEQVDSTQQQQNWSAATVSSQLRSWRLTEWANRRNKRLDFTADFDFDEFALRYAPLGCSGGRDGVESWVLERGWSNGEVVVGRERVWMREGCWWESENMLDIKQPGVTPAMMGLGAGPMDTGYTMSTNGSGFFPPGAQPGLAPIGSQDQLLRHQSMMSANKSMMGDPQQAEQEKGLLSKYEANHYTGAVDPEIGEPKHIEEHPQTTSRKIWAGFVWAMTFWIPSFTLRYIGRMKRPDVRMAWREKVTLVFLIFLINAMIIFWIVVFARLLCPNIDKAWALNEVKFHQGEDDFWVSIQGNVYDITKFWKIQHSDTNTETTKANMIEYAGQDLTAYFPPPLTLGCPGLIPSTMTIMTMQYNDTSAQSLVSGVHTSGPRTPDRTSALASLDWYAKKFKPKINKYWKGDLVWDKAEVAKQGNTINRPWVIIDEKIYDLTNYFYTAKMNKNGGAAGAPNYNYLDSALEDIVTENPGQDVTSLFYEKLNTTAIRQNKRCLDNIFYAGIVDFRKSAKCVASSYVLLAAAAVMASVILVKFLAALQLGSKRRPAQQDKFVICQVPAYTEGEDSLRKALDSLTALNYDNKRKLICVICDGMIVGGGNDRPTPNIVLEILGVDPKIDPPALPFKSVGEGSQQLNYGKVYSGLYEYEGCVVPYIVVVKVGKPSEAGKSKPGNRGKRDSQVLLMDFLNRVHHRTAMSPLQLEMFHQINNIIGVDPELYEYLLMVDADTSVKEDSLNRLVAACAHDAKIAGICGETSLENQERSWWTMIQVYEYYISHHLSKAFESLFGSVTCLPGCFSMYRLRTADKGRPLIISSKVIEEYSDGIVDTLHKKNLLSLGEDRYLTTLMTKHFPFMTYKFIPDAYALTAAPETWSILLSQRRRWINSTIHNLAELIWLEEMCGFCCFSMRFVVLLDLVGTIILPATCVYIGYLIYVIATKSGAFPYISLGMIAAVYGLQAIIFIIKKRWEHVGWMIIYILAFPIYSFVLPLYSFWAQDDFSWGNTRIVVGESAGKKIIATSDEEGFDPKSIPLQTWDEYATQNNLPGRRGGQEKFGPSGGYDDAGYEMDDMHSMYSSVKPASTILTGLPHRGHSYMPPQSPAPFGNNRQSTYSAYTNLTGHQQDQGQHQRLMSMGGMSQGDYWQEGPQNRRSSPMSTSGLPSTDNLLGMNTPPPPRGPSRSPLGFAGSRPVSTMDFTRSGGGPDDESIVEAIRSVLRDVDLDNITKKQVRALVEQRLQTECQGERRTFLDRQIDAELANMPM
ncbi:chitin synthase-domain-containing protein [Geopyxis carbonaria]|nr:chitin synthase-domain-containing protein [Geopyxis carbonaria]